MRTLLDGMIVGLASFGAAGAANSFLPALNLGPVNATPWGGAVLGGVTGMWLVKKLG